MNNKLKQASFYSFLCDLSLSSTIFVKQISKWLSCCRSWTCVYSLPISGHPSALASTLVRLLLFYDHPFGSRWAGPFQVYSEILEDFPYFSHLSWHIFHHDLQFIALESIITSLSDIYPAYMRKGYHREVVLFLICAFCYLVCQLLVSQVSHGCWKHEEFFTLKFLCLDILIKFAFTSKF